VTRAASESRWRRLPNGRTILVSLPKLLAGLRPPGDTRYRPPTAKEAAGSHAVGAAIPGVRVSGGSARRATGCARGPTGRRCSVDIGRTFDRGPCPAFAHLRPNSGPKPCSGPDFHFWRVTRTSSRARGPTSRRSSPDAHSSSAVVLRRIGGLARVTGLAAPWVDPLATLMSWLVPLTAFELREWTRRESRLFELDRPRVRAAQRRCDTVVGPRLSTKDSPASIGAIQRTVVSSPASITMSVDS
jgi:hypothetical protein